MRDILVLKAGSAANEVKLTAGDYDRWFAETLGTMCRLHVRQAHLSQRLPPPGDFDGVVITGSPLSVTAWTGWMERVGELVRDAAARRVPVLGVCFGHQLIARVFGGKVGLNPGGREIGTVEVDLTAAGRRDPLFDGVPARMAIQATHEDAVVTLPSGATVLAGNAACPVQAFAIGKWVRGVQFHPEASPATMR